jgi:hypothetical protein
MVNSLRVHRLLTLALDDQISSTSTLPPNTSADRTLFRQFVNMIHSRAVGGPVNSNSKPETCMEATEVFSDTNATRVLVAAPEYEGQSPSWIRCHQDYIERTPRPEHQNRVVMTFPCHVDMSKSLS